MLALALALMLVLALALMLVLALTLAHTPVLTLVPNRALVPNLTPHTASRRALHLLIAIWL